MIERATYDERDGRFLGFESGWCDPGAWTWVNVGPRTFCVDMAGFAFDSALLHRIPLASAVWNYTGHGGESELIGKLLGPDATAEDLQPLANCSASSSSPPPSRSFPLPHPPPLTSRRAPNSNPRPPRDENQATLRRACQRGEPPPPPPPKCAARRLHVTMCPCAHVSLTIHTPRLMHALDAGCVQAVRTSWCSTTSTARSPSPSYARGSAAPPTAGVWWTTASDARGLSGRGPLRMSSSLASDHRSGRWARSGRRARG
jgi:hypothetical protein